MILVTGGTGFLGSYLINYLLKQGKKVRAIRRANSKSLLLNGIDREIEWVEGDVLDVVALQQAMQGIEQVYHCAGVVSFVPKEKKNMMKVNVEGTANVVNIALENKVRKLVHVSSIAALGRIKHNREIDEHTHWEESKLNSAYAVSKYLAEMEAWRGITEGLNAVIVNPSVILGAGDWSNSALRFFRRAWKGMPFYSEQTTGFVDVRDVARVMIALMESNISNERFIVSSENLSYRELFNQMADNFSAKRPYIKVNPFMSALAWRVEKIRKLLTGGTPLVTEETARTANSSFLYSNAKVRNTLHYEFIPVKQTVKESCEKFLESMTQSGRVTILP